MAYKMAFLAAAVVLVGALAGASSAQADVNQIPTCTISANPSYLTQGNATILVWNSTDAQNASITQGVGIVSPFGSYTVYPQQGMTTYVLTVNGSGGSNTCSATVTTGYNNYNYNSYNQYYNQAPYCTISVSPSYIQFGGNVTLSWNAYGDGVYGPYIDNGVGSVGLSGSRTVNPYLTSVYRMTVSDRQGRTNTCSTTLQVGGSTYNPTTYYPNMYYPYYQQLALTNVPYTGTDDDMYFLFVLGLTAFAWGIVGYNLYTSRKMIASLIRA